MATATLGCAGVAVAQTGAGAGTASAGSSDTGRPAAAGLQSTATARSLGGGQRSAQKTGTTTKTRSAKNADDAANDEDGQDATTSVPAVPTAKNHPRAVPAVPRRVVVKARADAADTEPPAGDVAVVAERPVSATADTATERAAASTTAVAAAASVQQPAVSGDSVVEPTTSTGTLKVQQPVPVHTATGLPALVAFVGNLLFGAVTLLEQIVTGPPALPAGSTVTVRTSTLRVASGYVVSANWYFPDTDTTPTRLIYLQHGFLATGPMYSYTAAELAQETGAIVVTPTLLSNFFAGDGLWLGGDAMFRAVANLFVGDREALTTSAIAAGYATVYHLDSTDAVLPEQFALVGHSLGGALVAGAAGYLALNGAADDLVGVIMLDGVPTGNTMPDALGRVADYEQESGRTIPIRQIAAPWNSWNSPSNANQWLEALRPDTYKGVILRGGVHMDSMRGGNALIQFVAYLFAGFPTKVNQAAVGVLAVDWLKDWFSGDTGEEDAPEGGSTIAITTPYGDAYAVVIGSPSAAAATAENTSDEVATKLDAFAV
jgi:hypothetical protein